MIKAIIQGAVLEDICDDEGNVVLPEGAVVIDDGFSDHVQCLSTGEMIYLDGELHFESLRTLPEGSRPKMGRSLCGG